MATASARDDVGAQPRLCAAGVALCVQGAGQERHHENSPPEPQASLLTGILLGDDSGIS
jgi:hypothetical protein